VRGDRSRRGELTRLSGDVRRELDRHGPQAGMTELLARWPEAVGTAIARIAWPARIGRDGTVHVNTADSVWAFELGRRAVEIAARLDAPRVRFAPGPLPSADDAVRDREVVHPTAEDESRAEAIARAIEDEELRKRVKRAVALGLAKAPPDRSV
jgi:hypothetical protein